MLKKACNFFKVIRYRLHEIYIERAGSLSLDGTDFMGRLYTNYIAEGNKFADVGQTQQLTFISAGR
jgi:hypothetical protein